MPFFSYLCICLYLNCRYGTDYPIVFCGLHGVALFRHVAHRAPRRHRQRGFFPGRSALPVVRRGVWHDWRLALGSDLHVRPWRRLWRSVDLHAAGFRLCAWICCHCVGTLAVILQIESHLHLHLPQPALRCGERENGSSLLHYLASPRFCTAYVSCCLCAL